MVPADLDQPAVKPSQGLPHVVIAMLPVQGAGAYPIASHFRQVGLFSPLLAVVQHDGTRCSEQGDGVGLCAVAVWITAYTDDVAANFIDKSAVVVIFNVGNGSFVREAISVRIECPKVGGGKAAVVTCLERREQQGIEPSAGGVNGVGIINRLVTVVCEILKDQ